MEEFIKTINTYFTPVHRRYVIAMLDVFVIWLNIWHQAYAIWILVALLNIPLLTFLYFDLEKVKLPKKKKIQPETITNIIKE